MEINSNSLPSLAVSIYGNAFHAMCLECGTSKAFEMDFFFRHEEIVQVL